MPNKYRLKRSYNKKRSKKNKFKRSMKGGRGSFKIGKSRRRKVIRGGNNSNAALPQFEGCLQYQSNSCWYFAVSMLFYKIPELRKYLIEEEIKYFKDIQSCKNATKLIKGPEAVCRKMPPRFHKAFFKFVLLGN